MHPAQPNVIYQQNHCGVYRSDNCGEDWIDIGEGKLPARFGFPIAIHPTDPRTVYVALEESDEYRMSVDGKFSVWRSRDAGESWERMTKGLPEKAHLLVLREAMATDSFEDAGIYAGTGDNTSAEVVFNRFTILTADKAKAEFENGILTLSLPKAEVVKPKQIKITTK